MNELDEKKPKILLVDDEQLILNSETRLLRKWTIENNVEILTASSGKEALEIVGREQGNIALIVSDEKMPGISGSDLLNRINKDYPRILTIILTGYSSFDSVMVAIKAGIHSYMLKPVENDIFINEVDKVFQLYKLRKENEEHSKRIKNELKWASELQKKLLAVDCPDNDKIFFDVIYEPVKEMGCGGDFYDIVKLDDERYLLFLGDVAGHGIKAAFITTMIKQIIRGELLNGLDLNNVSTGKLLSSLNRLFFRYFSDMNNIMVTFSVHLFDCGKMLVASSNGGHLPFVRIGNGKSEKIGTPEMALGFQEEVIYKEFVAPMEKGDKFIFLTDGLIEVPGSSIMEQMELLQSTARALNGDDMLYELKTFFGDKFPGGIFPDDITIILVNVK